MSTDVVKQPAYGSEMCSFIWPLKIQLKILSHEKWIEPEIQEGWN